jgi:hypothetical protein
MFVASSALSDELAGVSLEIDPCVDADRELVRRLFRVELGTSLPEGAVSEGPAGTRVEVACAGALVELRVEDAVTGKSLVRRISPGARTGRERLLALAAMELLVASWIELEAMPEPVARGADSTADTLARQAARQVVRKRLPKASRWTTTATAIGGSSWAGSFRYGGGVRVCRDHAGGYGWGADVIAETAVDDLSLGEVTTTSVSGALTAHLERRFGPVLARAAIGARIGAVSMRGDPEGRSGVLGSEVSGLAGGPMARLGAQLTPASGLTLALSVESGAHALEMRGTVDGREEQALDGAWLGGHLGVGWTW